MTSRRFVSFALFLATTVWIWGATPLADGPAISPASLAAVDVAYTQNFDTLAGTGTSTAVPTGWGFDETGTNANGIYTAGTGSSTAGDTYSFGTSGDRALGQLRSGALVFISVIRRLPWSTLGVGAGAGDQAGSGTSGASKPSDASAAQKAGGM